MLTATYILAANREQLISQNMLEEGHSREEAEAAIAGLLEIVSCFQEASVRLDVKQDRLNLNLGLSLKRD